MENGFNDNIVRNREFMVEWCTRGFGWILGDWYVNESVKIIFKEVDCLYPIFFDNSVLLFIDLLALGVSCCSSSLWNLCIQSFVCHSVFVPADCPDQWVVCHSVFVPADCPDQWIVCHSLFVPADCPDQWVVCHLVLCLLDRSCTFCRPHTWRLEVQSGDDHFVVPVLTA